MAHNVLDGLKVAFPDAVYTTQPIHRNKIARVKREGLTAVATRQDRTGDGVLRASVRASRWPLERSDHSGEQGVTTSKQRQFSAATTASVDQDATRDVRVVEPDAARPEVANHLTLANAPMTSRRFQ